MNNMLEYMTGGQCYKCGGKVRYADGGENMQGEQPMDQQSSIANVGMQQPQRQPSTIDASAKQLMTFLLAQLQKGTSESILKKTLMDSGLKSEQATELLEVAKEEFNRSIKEGDYPTSAEEEQMQMMARQQQMAQQQMMMGQPGANAGMDPSMMAMNQQTDQSQLADAEMQARFGGSMKKLRRMNMGGTCPEGYIWNDIAGNCMPSSTTSSINAAGNGPVNIGGNAPVTQQQAIQQSNITNQNTIAQAKAQDKQRNAELGYYDQLLNAGATNRTTQFNNRMTAMGGLHDAMLQGKLPWQQPTTPVSTTTQPQVNQGVTQDEGANAMARFGGLTRFVNGGLKKYGPGGGFNPMEIKEYISNLQSKATMPVADPNNIGRPQGYGPGIAGGSSANLPQINQFIKGMQDKMTMAMPEKNNNATNNNNNNNNTDAAPIDPRLTNSPYIVRTDKNKIANLDNNWVNKALAVGSNLGSAQTLGATGAFGPYLQMLLGATGAVSSAALGAKKIFAGDKRTVYDDKGNVFEYGNKRSFRRAGRDDSSDQSNQQNNNQQQDDQDKDKYSDLSWGQRRAIRRGENAIARNDKRLQERLAEDPNYLDTPKEGEIVAYEDGNVFDRSRDAGNYEGGQNPDMYKQSYWDTKKKDYQDLDDAAYSEKYGSSKADDSDESGTGPLMPPDYNNLGKTVRDAEGNWFIDKNPNDPSQGRYMIPDKKRPSEAGYDRWKSDDPNNPASGSWWNNQKESAMTIPSQQEGGEWNPFVDNRRKLRIGMQMYNTGGRVDNESFPYTQAEWAQKKGKPLPLSQQDVADYDTYVKNFNVTTPQINTTNNANNALSNNPNANMVDTKKITVETGDPLGARVAQNLYSGLSGWNAGLEEIQGRNRINEIAQKRQQFGNSMEYAAVNPWNQSGTIMANETQGSNIQVDSKQQGATQDFQTTLNAKFGGSLYRRGGTYMVSPQELQAIIAMGGEVEFLD